MMENKISKLTINFLNWFNALGSMKNVTKEEVSKYASPTIHFYLNGNLLAEGLDSYWERVNALKNSVKKITVNLPPENLVVEKNTAAVNYIEDITQHDDVVRRMVNGMFLTFDSKGKIIKLYDVFNGADPVKK